MKSPPSSVFFIFTLMILGVSSTGLTNSARVASVGLATGSRGISDATQSSVGAAAAKILGSVDAATSGIVASINSAAAKATADVQSAAAKEKAEIDAALAAIKSGLIQIEGCIEISVNAAVSAKALTSNIKTKLISVIEAGADQIDCDVKAGVESLNIVLQEGKVKRENDAHEGATEKKEAIQEAMETLVLNMRREAYDGIGYNAIVADNTAIKDVLANRATVLGNNLNTDRRIAGVQVLPHASLGSIGA